MAISQMVGASIKRREDPRLVTGTGSYVDDIQQTALVHMHVVRSSEAHARILGIETGRAKEADGVVAIEPRGVLADYKTFSNKLTVWSSTQIPHFVKVWLAVILGISESNVRVVAPEVGGGFGSKIRVYPEEILTALASRRLGRPVKWIEDRNENVKATHHGRDQIWDVEIAAKKDGTVLGIRPTQWLNLGGYCSQFGTFQVLGMLVAQGAYKMKAFDGRAVGVFTNTTPTDAHRGAGRPGANHPVASVIDLVARETGIHPGAIRRKKFSRAEDQPSTALLGLTHNPGVHP